jgi:adenylate kinase family enzyme
MYSKQLISISGYSGAGKSTVGSMIAQRGYVEFSWCTALRRAVATQWFNDSILGKEHLLVLSKYLGRNVTHIIPDKSWEDSSGFQQALVDASPETKLDCYVTSCKLILALLHYEKKVVISDTRFPREYEFLWDLTAFMINVTKKERVREVRKYDALLDFKQFDWELKNDGTIEEISMQIQRYL